MMVNRFTNLDQWEDHWMFATSQITQIFERSLRTCSTWIVSWRILYSPVGKLCLLIMKMTHFFSVTTPGSEYLTCKAWIV
jgi:hypothetical protein